MTTIGGANYANFRSGGHNFQTISKISIETALLVVASQEP